jgi:uncharacterized protein (TIGR01777 family)
MKVLITGASGLIGSALAASLRAQGHEVIPLARGGRPAGTPYWDPEKGVIDLGGAAAIEAVVHLAGESLAAGRWTAVRKARILNSRVRGTRLLAGFFAQEAHKPGVFVAASAVGFYGDRGEEVVDELSAPGRGFLAAVCRQWEQAAAPAAGAGIRVVNLRLGLVLSGAGGVLKKMLPPFRMGLGAVIGAGRQAMSWVSLADAVRMIEFVLAHPELRGPVILASPAPATQAELAKTLGRVLRRPVPLRLPAWSVRLALGEMAEELLLSGARVRPGKLLAAGYPFLHPGLEEALRRALGRTERD